MAARGVPAGAVSGWYRQRARTGHPEKAGRIGRTDYWYEDEWTTWHHAYLRGKIDSLTEVDRGGDPDDLVDAAEAARMMRYSSRDAIHGNRRLGYFPEPDAFGSTAKFGWYLDYDGVLDGAWRDYLTLETAASRISVYEAQRIPGLLQTPAYAQALADTDPALKDDAARRSAVEAVVARQRAVLREGGPEVQLIIGQAALQQQVGSAAAMKEQLRALARIAGDSGSVTVQVLPFDSGAHAAAGEGSVSILQFDQTPGLGLVHIGGIGGGVCLDGQNDLGTYTGVFEQLAERFTRCDTRPPGDLRHSWAFSRIQDVLAADLELASPV